MVNSNSVETRDGGLDTDLGAGSCANFRVRYCDDWLLIPSSLILLLVLDLVLGFRSGIAVVGLGRQLHV